MRRGGSIFQTMKTEGAILPADLLRRILDGDRDVPGLTSEDYHLTKSERLNEVATRSWNRLQGAWESFKDAMDKLPETDAGTTLTRERWLLILFQELGYGRLTTCKAYEIDGRIYPISHEWQKTPIHLVSFRQELDKRTPGRAGAARVSPHSLVQELLNRSDDHMWGMISNGLTLRLLRDNVSLTRQAYVEFDLQAMMDSEAYSDFFLLFLLCHQSRVEVPEGKTPASCWLERWYNTAAQQGVRALDQLRDGVQNAIEALGGGFLAHPANEALREKLRAGRLNTQDYYRQVLRQVYRLLFLFVAEDREMLFHPQSSIEARKLYTEHYSTHRLRTLAAKTRGTRHPDQWRALRLVLDKLHDGCEQLALPALGSFLFAPKATPDLNDIDVANTDLLKAFRSLAFTEDRAILRPVNYRNLGSEELGSVYESLLEMHPAIYMEATNPADRFRLSVAVGSERKTTGSYYTPTSLVNCLLDSALEPVIDDATRKKTPTEAEQALLKLRVCDPACGSGHFLISAAHRMAKRLAAIRAGEDEPGPESVQRALRDVVGHCIYGVDINSMAVELCKVSLWIEALEPGKPLSFLDHHVKCGNSLLGTTPALMKEGIPDDALAPIEGDIKAACSELKRQNREERKRGQRYMRFGEEKLYPWDKLGNLASMAAQLEELHDDDVQSQEEKQKRYDEFVSSTGYEYGHLLADLWCAAFVVKKDRSFDYGITESIFRDVEKTPHELAPWLKDEIKHLATDYRFFHWHLEFPAVFRVPSEAEKEDNEQTGWSGGFDCILGNPPWERIKLQEKEFFAARNAEIANAANAAARQRMIAELPETDPLLYQTFRDTLRRADGESRLVRDTNRYPLCGRGDVNTYTIFAELNRSLISGGGRIGCIVPSGIATDATTQYFFQDLIKTRSLVSLYDFENRKNIFPAIDSRMKFCLLTLTGPDRPHKQAEFVFFAYDVQDLADFDRRFILSPEDISLFNPNTCTCPTFRSNRDAELTRALYRRVPVLVRGQADSALAANPWRFDYMTKMFDMADNSHEFIDYSALLAGAGERKELDWHHPEGRNYAPLYEAKNIHLFDHRWADSVTTSEDVGGIPSTAKRDATFNITTRYWVDRNRVEERIATKSWDRGWLIGWRDITNATNERTVIMSSFPRTAAAHTLRVAFVQTGVCTVPMFIACLSTFVLDYVARQKVGGTHLTVESLKQLPVIPPDAFSEADRRFIVPRILELTHTCYAMQPFAHDCGYDAPPFVWNDERRFLIRCELDAAFFHLYLGSEQEWKKGSSKELPIYFPTPRDAVGYIMETFPIIKRKDEQAHGCYRTKETILAIYDEMVEVMQQSAATHAAGRQPAARYRTRLDPPPGPPTDAAGNFVPMSQWDDGIWKRYANVIHAPKEEPVTVATTADLEILAALSYPVVDADMAVNAAALAIIEQAGEISSIDHLDALLLVTHPEWCKAFLDSSDQKRLDTALPNAPAALCVDNAASIRWKDCRDYLEQRGALNVARDKTVQLLSAGRDLTTVRASLPRNVDEVVALAMKALRQVQRVRDNVAAAPRHQQPALRMFVQQHGEYRLAI